MRSENHHLSLPEKAEWKAHIPLERYGSVKEIAKTTRFLVSSGSSYITDQNLRADGGIMHLV